MENVKRITKKLIKIVKRASKIYLNKNFFELKERHKFENDDVTNLDIKTQDYLKNECYKLFKNINFIGEEGKEESNSPLSVVVDPIDGTFNFKHKINNFGSQICLLERGEPIISILYLPKSNELYYANKFGAFKNGIKIKVSENTDLKQSIALLGDFVKETNFSVQKQCFNIINNHFKRIRMLGSSCVDNCFMSEGKADVYIIFSSNKWDLIPGQFLIKMAGGQVVCNLEKNIYISGNKYIVDEVVALLKAKGVKFE